MPIELHFPPCLVYIRLVIFAMLPGLSPTCAEIKIHRHHLRLLNRYLRFVLFSFKEFVVQLLPALAHLICHEDKDVVSDACWALSYLTDGNTERIQAVVDSGVIPRLIELLGSKELICVVSLYTYTYMTQWLYWCVHFCRHLL